MLGLVRTLDADRAAAQQAHCPARWRRAWTPRGGGLHGGQCLSICFVSPLSHSTSAFGAGPALRRHHAGMQPRAHLRLEEHAPVLPRSSTASGCSISPPRQLLAASQVE